MVAACVVLAARPLAAQDVVPIPRSAPAASASAAPSIEPPADLTGWTGRPISRVSVVLEGSTWTDVEIPAVRDVKAGEPFTPALARKAVAEVLGAGHFARARATIVPDGGAVALIVRAAPRKLVDRLLVELHGAPLDGEELLRDAELADGGEIVAADIPDTNARIARYCAVHGFPSAKVEVQTRATDDPARALVIVDVAAGEPVLVDERRFYVFAAAPDEVRPVDETYAVRRGDRADEPALDASDAALEQALHARGWHRARVTHDLVRMRAGPVAARAAAASAGPVVLRVRVDAGPRQVPRFEGNDHYDPETLTAALGLETESDRSPAHLAEKLRAFYEKRGFRDVEVHPDVRGGETDPVQVLFFRITEHPRVSVSARSYPCLPLDVVEHLSNGGPRSASDIGNEIDSYLEEELPGADLLVNPEPRGVSETLAAGAGQVATGARPAPIDLQPDATFVADTYDRAAVHIRELYRNEGFLHAEVGPVQIVRA
ncbi:MAG: hypothetical protein JOZ69_13520, partial [Myxococcales bacterium]|nr:hypothetical protein [Myxococcales bacterium]